MGYAVVLELYCVVLLLAGEEGKGRWVGSYFPVLKFSLPLEIAMGRDQRSGGGWLFGGGEISRRNRKRMRSRRLFAISGAKTRCKDLDGKEKDLSHSTDGVTRFRHEIPANNLPYPAPMSHSLLS